jgi:ribonuclease T1
LGSRRRITAALIGLIALVLGGWLIGQQWDTRDTAAPPGADSGLPVRALSELPPEAASTWRLVQRGGPFPFPNADGDVFQNREKRLPAKDSGYYREYTVPTPGSADRGQRRLVTGSGGELYYTEDHYGSFVLVDPGR